MNPDSFFLPMFNHLRDWFELKSFYSKLSELQDARKEFFHISLHLISVSNMQ